MSLTIANYPLQPTRKIELLRTEVGGIGELACAEGKTSDFCKEENESAMAVKDEDLKDGTIMEGEKGAAIGRKSETDEKFKDGTLMEGKKEAAIGVKSETDEEFKDGTLMEGKKEAAIGGKSETDEEFKDGTLMEGKKEAAIGGKSKTDEEFKDGTIMERKKGAAIDGQGETDLDGRYEASADGKKGEIYHNEACSTINKLVEETKSAINDLADQFGGVSGLLEAPLVRDGLLTFRDPLPRDSVPSSETNKQTSDYELARWKLTEAYAKYGKEYKSRVAFQLAVENVLDLICLSYFQELGNFMCNNSKSTVGWHMYKYSGWMVAANMDQQALNFLCYFPERKKLRRHLPFLELANDKDIEGDSYFEMLKEDSIDSRDGWFHKKWFHGFMIIALIKLKKLLVQFRSDEASWMAFMEGTNPGAGETSTVLSISGMAPVLQMLQELVLDHSRNPLTDQIDSLLTAVNDRNPFLIPGLLDSTTLEGPTFPEVDERRELTAPIPPVRFWDDGMTDIDRDIHIHNVRFAVNNYGFAWHMEKDYTDALKLFLDTGSVIPKKKISLVGTD